MKTKLIFILVVICILLSSFVIAENQYINGTFSNQLAVIHFNETTGTAVSDVCFMNSSDIETAGTMTGFKIESKEILDFRITELQNKGFKEVI